MSNTKQKEKPQKQPVQKEVQFSHADQIFEKCRQKSKTQSKNRPQEEKQVKSSLRYWRKVLILAERVRKKDAPGKFYKSTIENRSFFRKTKYTLLEQKQKIKYTVIKRTKIYNIFYYWFFILLSHNDSDKIIHKRFQRQELYALTKQFLQTFQVKI